MAPFVMVSQTHGSKVLDLRALVGNLSANRLFSARHHSHIFHILRSKLHPLICEAQSHIRTDTKPSKSNNIFWNTTTCVYRRTWKTRGGPDLVRASWVHLVFGKYQKFRATNFKMGTKWGSCKHCILENSEARICIQTWYLK